MTHAAQRLMGAAVVATALVAAMHLGCEQILGIHDLDGGAGDDASNDAGMGSSASGSSSGKVGSSASGSSGASSSSGGSSSASGSSSGRGSSTSGGSSSGGSSSGGSSSSGSSSGSSSTSSGADGGTGSSGSSSCDGGGPVTLATLAQCSISGDTHWSEPVYVIQCDLNVDATLTIDPGVIVKFGIGHGMTVSSSGTVYASGTAAAPIVFTSVRDSTQGCNTGGAAMQAPGDWKGIALEASGSTFDHCAFYYAGASDTAALSSGTNSVTVTNSVFAHNAGPTVNINGAPALDAGSAAAGTTIQNNVFYANMIPLRISQNLSLDNTNLFDNSAVAPSNPQPNQFNGIEFVGGNCGSFNEVVNNIRWSATQVPFIIGNALNGNTCLQLDNGGQLTLAKNVTMKFFGGGRLSVGSTGMLTTAAGDVFTSIKDDASIGDTNGDQSGTSPAPHDWIGVDVSASGMTFDHCAFYYAGGSAVSDKPALFLNGVQATVTYSTFAHDQGPINSIVAEAALDAGSATAGTSIANNLFYDDLWPLRISQGVSIDDDSNSFDNSAAAPANPQANEFNGIEFIGGNCGSFNAIVSNVNWKAKKVPFVIGSANNSCLEVDTGGTLTLGDGVTLKFFQGGKLLVSSSTATLTTGTGDVFTSIKDDAPAHGGDTDNDSMAMAPAAGDWSGVEVNGTCETWSNIYYSTVGCPP